jgi:integrase
MAITKRKLKSGGVAWKVQVRDKNGKLYPVKQFPTKEAAKPYERELEDLKAKDGEASNSQDRKITLSQFYHNTWKHEGRQKVSEGWRSSQDQMFRDHIEPFLGNAKMIEIQKKDISKLLSRLKEQSELKPATVKQVYTLLSSIFRFSIEIYEIRESNPVLRIFKPEVDEFKRTYLSPERARDFLEVTADHWMGPAIWLMVGTGIRVCELIGLQYGDLDLVNHKLLLRRQWIRKAKKLGPVKNKKAETPIPIPHELADYLKSRLSPLANPTDWVIQRQRQPGAMSSYHTLYRALKRLAEKHQFPLSLSPHGLRHTTSGLWKEHGAQRSDLRDLYNHSDDSTTKIYDHDVPERLRGIASQVRLKKQRTLTIVK